MKKIFFTFILLTTSKAFSQSPKGREYTYDNAGNRIKRTPIVFNTSGLPSYINVAPNNSLIAQKEQEELFKLFPNTTDGNITVDAMDKTFMQLENKELMVYDLIGRIVLHQNYNEEQKTIDLSNQVSGMYIVKLTANGIQKAEWNVLKR